MLEFGNTLKKAREAKGYTVSQLAETTHILAQIIECMEREDFSKIVAPIYGRGFVRLYCEAVGLEAKPMIDEFMEIFSGNRPPVIRMKPEEERPVVREEAPVVEERPVVEAPVERPVVEAPVERPVVREEAPVVEERPVVEAPVERRDYRPPSYYMPDVPRRFWRMAILVGGAIVLIALIVLAGRTLYRATMGTSDETEQKGEKSVENVAPRKPMSVPPLYID